MSLLVPPEVSRDINRYSGFLSSKSKFSQKNLKALFRCPENLRYLAKGLYNLITNPWYVGRNSPLPTEDYRDYAGFGIRTGFNNNGDPDASITASNMNRLITAFKSRKDFLEENIEDLVEMTEIPYAEDIVVSNPIQQLHFLNRDFLLKTSRNIIQSPEMLIPRFHAINPETGEDESHIEYDYTSESYSDGVWHPEHLFTNSQRNHNNPYWVPLEVNYYANDNSKGPGHRYYSGQYSATKRTRSQFPRWQYSVDDAPLEKDVNETLREGGISDRRTQRNRGYNMMNLVSKSTY
jgi:hypothetical protein